MKSHYGSKSGTTKKTDVVQNFQKEILLVPFKVYCQYVLLQTLIEKDLPHPFGLALHDDRVYWTDWQDKAISFANKRDGSNRGKLRTDLEDLMDIHVFHRRRQPGGSPQLEITLCYCIFQHGLRL